MERKWMSLPHYPHSAAPERRDFVLRIPERETVTVRMSKIM